MRDTVEEPTSTAVRERGGLGTEMGAIICTLSKTAHYQAPAVDCIIKLDMIYTIHRRMHMIL